MKGNTDQFIVQKPEGHYRLKLPIEITHLVWALLYVEGFALLAMSLRLWNSGLVECEVVLQGL